MLRKRRATMAANDHAASALPVVAILAGVMSGGPPATRTSPATNAGLKVVQSLPPPALIMQRIGFILGGTEISRRRWWLSIVFSILTSMSESDLGVIAELQAVLGPGIELTPESRCQHASCNESAISAQRPLFRPIAPYRQVAANQRICIERFRRWQSPGLMGKTSSAAAPACATVVASAGPKVEHVVHVDSASGRCPERRGVGSTAGAAPVP